MANIDLDELAARESERVEWKENAADIDQVIKTIVAFANDISNLGGGYVVCGAQEGKDEDGFQKLLYTGLTAARLKEIEMHFSTVPLFVILPSSRDPRNTRNTRKKNLFRFLVL